MESGHADENGETLTEASPELPDVQELSEAIFEVINSNQNQFMAQSFIEEEVSSKFNDLEYKPIGRVIDFLIAGGRLIQMQSKDGSYDLRRYKIAPEYVQQGSFENINESVRGRGSEDEAPHNEAASEQDHVGPILTPVELKRIEIVRSFIDEIEDNFFTDEQVNDFKYLNDQIRKQCEELNVNVYSVLRYFVKTGELREVKTDMGNDGYIKVNAQDSSEDDGSDRRHG